MARDHRAVKTMPKWLRRAVREFHRGLEEYEDARIYADGIHNGADRRRRLAELDKQAVELKDVREALILASREIGTGCEIRNVK
jgi:hypothetical protein